MKFKLAATLTVLSAILYCSWPLGFWLNPQANQRGLASELGAFGQPFNWLFIGADVVSGIFLMAACYLLAQQFKVTGWRKLALISLAFYGLFGAIDASLPIHCLPSLQQCGSVFRSPLVIFHGAVDIAGSLSLTGTLVAEWIYTRRHHAAWLTWIYVIGGGGVVFAGLSLLFIIMDGPGYWAQRYYITLSCVWVASLPFVFRAQSNSAANNTDQLDFSLPKK